MEYRVAVSSTDGKVVNQHFGRTEKFHILEVSEDGFHYLESRSVEACCHSGDHEIDSFYGVLKVLNDVGAIIVSKIGKGASAFLEEKGLVIYEAPYPIEPLMEKIVRERIYEVDKWRSHTMN